jgi:hypothetical protein
MDQYAPSHVHQTTKGLIGLDRQASTVRQSSWNEHEVRTHIPYGALFSCHKTTMAILNYGAHEKQRHNIAGVVFLRVQF